MAKVKLELVLELSPRALFGLMKQLEMDQYSGATFGNGQSTIDANEALGALMAEVRRQLDVRPLR